MLDSSAWNTMPKEQITLQTRALAFAAVSRLQGSVHYYLDMVWDGFPFRAFRMLDETLDLDKEVSAIHGTCPGLQENKREGEREREREREREKERKKRKKERHNKKKRKEREMRKRDEKMNL